jgi:hypothetical protein
VSWGVSLALVARLATTLAQPSSAPPPPPPPPPMAQPPPPPPPPEAQAPTRATFISTSAEPWDVVVDGQPMCATPCTGPLSPVQFVVLQSQERSPILLEVGRLPPGELVVSGKPLQSGMYAGGVVATTFGGMAVAVGIVFTAVGLAKDRDGMTTAGLITGGVGAFTLASGIYLMVKALPSVRVDRAMPGLSGMAAGIAGTF